MTYPLLLFGHPLYVPSAKFFVFFLPETLKSNNFALIKPCANAFKTKIRMSTTTKHKNTLARTVVTLFMVLAMTLTASATDFITDVMVVGNKNQSQFNTLIENLEQQGWTDINQDLNQGCGSSSDYIHLLYKKQSSSGNTSVPITDFYIRTGSNPPSSLTHGGRTYYLVPYDGSERFINNQGDLNSGCGSNSAYIFLYYTKDVLSNNHGVTAISINDDSSGAVGENGGNTGYDLNSGGGGTYIYMHFSTTTGGNVVPLSSGSREVQLLNGHILTGTGGAETHVTIADGATVTLSGVNITSIADNDSHAWPGISCLGNATIVLGGNTTNNVKGGYQSSGIHVADNKTLTLQGDGTLNATGDFRAAGIGSGPASSCGNITISGGTVNATGGENAAGIGSGWNCSCGIISIRGGTVDATGGQKAAGIGSGYNYSDCWHILIYNTVTSVTATKGTGCDNAIGAGANGSTCQSVTIGGIETGFITQSPFTTYPYTVAFNANGGTGATMANQSFMYNVAQNLYGNVFSRTYYAFEGWATTADGPKVYNDEQSVSNLTNTSGATVTLYAKWVFLGTIPGEIVLHDGDILTGIGGVHTHVSIANGATVTFSGVDITAILEDDNHKWPGITCLGDAVIVLDEGTTNSVKGGKENPGIYVPHGHTLTLQGSGTLNTIGGQYAAGIGSGWESSCGDITISGGTITATGGFQGAGIGSGYESSCGDITINGGTVTATGGVNAVGIGCGQDSSCGDITINGGSVTATGGGNSAGIGSGWESSCGDITISGGTVTATGGGNSAGIGSGFVSSCGNIAISGGTVTANGGDGGAGIGSGRESSCGDISISGGTVTATGGDNSAGIGSRGIFSCGNIAISGGTVTATGGSGAAGIGSGMNSSCGTVTINGGTVTANGGDNGAGIGCGYYSSCGTVTISGGTVTATGGENAAGIGSGRDSSCDNITISGGTITATGGYRGAGIGSGFYSSCGTVTITNGVTRVTATKGDNCDNAIGKGNSDATCGTVTIGDVETGFITQSPFITFPYTLAFNANGGTGTMNDQSFMYNVAQKLTANSFTYSGHAFQGWATTADGPKVYDDRQSVSNLADTIATVTLYAKWEALPITTVTQTVTLAEGWNWFSTYIDLGDPVALLDMLKEALGENGVEIQSYDDNTEYYDGEWFGGLDESGITNDKTFLILVSNDCTFELEGPVVDPTTVSITLHNGWNWIGFPFDHEVEIAVAFADFNAEEGDVIQTSTDQTEFDGDEWFGDIETLLPGQGVMYFSNSETPKVLVFHIARRSPQRKAGTR